MFLNEVRYIPFSEFSPYENMAIDEYLINYYESTKRPVLRIYSWKPAGISIGKNQDIDTINIEACKNDAIPVVRRLTGGGAIFHDKEVTYCLVCSENDISEKKISVKGSFEVLNRFLLKMYEKFGLKAQFAKDTGKTGNPSARTPHCFSDNEEYDIIINNMKIGGNAQKRKRGMIFQHGSIPLRKSTEQKRYFQDDLCEENYTDLDQLLGRYVAREEVEANLVAAFMETFDTDLKQQSLDRDEKIEIVKLLTSKYAANRWNIDGKE